MTQSNQKSERIEPFKKVRLIKTTQCSDRGNVFTDKNLLEGYVQFESLLEEGLYQLLDHDPNCVDMESQPVEIFNKNRKGKPYVPDAWAKFKDKTQYIFDVKHQDYLDSLKSNKEKLKKWNNRYRIVKEYCDNNGLLYMVVTNNEIWNERHENVDFFEKDKKKPEKFLNIEPFIKKICQNNPSISRIDLAKKISENGFDINDAIHSIDYMIYNDNFLLDFESKISNETLLQLKSDMKLKIISLYQYFLNIKNTKIIVASNKKVLLELPSTDPSKTTLDLQEFDALSEKIKKKINERLKSMEIFDSKDFNSEKLKTYAKKKEIHFTTLYRWKKNFDQYGWRGLIPDNKKAGRKRGFNKKIEDLIQKAIEEHYLVNTQPSITGSYKFFKFECRKAEIEEDEIPHYDTFRNRIKEISDTEVILLRRGRKEFRDKFKPLMGKYPFGKHPLALVEFDHTPLDVILVDRKDRQPIGRPTLTLAIDVYSRMIYGYYLSFDPPNTIAVGMCLLNGILPKDTITKFYETQYEWSINGIPKNILLDNSKEFRSQAMFNFCKRYGIKQRFNPVHRPDLKPHIERVFRTINEAIRDEGIGGYTASIEDNRKTKYDPSKHAVLTQEELETWLIKWIVDEYQMRIHLGIKEKDGIEITPLERYKQGIVEANGRMIGTPRIPKDWDQLRFDLLPFEKRTLQREGVRLFNLKYYHSVISKLRAIQKSSNKKYIIKYDPRDIREVYLWVDLEKQYYKLALSDAHLPELLINPKDPKDYPLSIKELELMKQEKIRKSPSVSQRDLAKSMSERQEIILKAKQLKKSAKSARKRQEKIQVNKQKATSTQIRNGNEINEGVKAVKKTKIFTPSVNFSEENKSNGNEKKIKPEIYSVSFWDEEED